MTTPTTRITELPTGWFLGRIPLSRRKYRRWAREAPMHLWQMDLVGGIFLARRNSLS